MNAAATPRALRDWIVEHLDPLEDRDPVKAGLEYDAGFVPPSKPSPVESLTPAAVLVGLIEREGGYSVLLTRRADTLRRHTGQIALPGGRLDPGETPWGAALREAHEEVGLHPEFVEIAGLSSPYATGTGYLITPVVGFVRSGFELEPNPHEVAEIFETPFGFLMDPANHEEHEREFNGVKRRFYAMTHEDRFIWGATAGMLRMLYNRLYGAAVA